MVNVAILGAEGGRERALEHAMLASPEVDRIVVSADPRAGLEQFAGEREKPFVIIGPERPLIAGLADVLRAEGYVVLGASKNAAQYEARKSRSTLMMRMAGILHADTVISETREQDQKYIKDKYFGSYVIKADGLARGQGVVIPTSLQHARETVKGMRDGSLYYGAGEEIINFARLHKGEEVSAMVSKGKAEDDFIILPLAQDFKRQKDGDKGPNTGGMGSYAPVPESIVDSKQYEKIKEIAARTFWGMQQKGAPYEQAVLYIGLMMSELEDKNPLVIEYNVRFGDPEAQAILPLLTRAGVDAYRLLYSTALGEIEKPDVDFSWLGHAAVVPCLAAAGYPEKPQTGEIVHGLDTIGDDPDIIVHKAAVQEVDGKTVTTGGRALYVVGLGEDLDAAADKAYSVIGPDGIHFKNMQFRRDIGPRPEPVPSAPRIKTVKTDLI